MVEEYQLSNGIRVICDRLENVHSVAFGVWVTVGSQDEDEKNNGMAHMLEHMVFKGTKRRTAAQIADEIADIGGNLDAYTSKEWTSYYGWVLKENLLKTIDLLGDMLAEPLFSEEELLKEKGIVMEEIDMYKDSAEDVVHEMLQKSIWESHPLGYLISGEHESVESFSREDLVSFHKKYYTAENMLISIAGCIDIKEILPKIEETFSVFLRTAKKKDVEIPVFHPCIYVESKDIEQIHINLAYDSITSIANERYAFSVLNAIVGGGANSRLFMKIREEMGIAYAIYSYGSSYQSAGLFHLYAAVNSFQTESALEAMGQEMKRFAKEGPTDAELVRAKEQIKTDLIIQGESTKGHMSSNAREILQFGNILSLEDTIKQVNAVTADEVVGCMERFFSKERLAAAFAGNLEEMPERLRTISGLQEYF